MNELAFLLTMLCSHGDCVIDTDAESIAIYTHEKVVEHMVVIDGTTVYVYRHDMNLNEVTDKEL